MNVSKRVFGIKKVTSFRTQFSAFLLFVAANTNTILSNKGPILLSVEGFSTTNIFHSNTSNSKMSLKIKSQTGNGNDGEDSTYEKNVLGGKLEVCSLDPLTGFTRNGCCSTGPMDFGSHTVCASVTQDFLLSQRNLGNDLMTARPEYNFPGLKAGDRWCLCASRWEQARQQGIAPPVYLKATHEKALTKVKLEHLQMYAADESTSQNRNIDNTNQINSENTFSPTLNEEL